MCALENVTFLHDIENHHLGSGFYCGIMFLKVPCADYNFIENCFCDFSQSLKVVGSSHWTASYNFQGLAKITEANFNKIIVSGTFTTQFRIEIHLLNDDSQYHVKK